MFGEARLRTLVEKNLSLTGAPLIERLVSEIQIFTGRQNFEDDLCVVAAESPGSLTHAPSVRRWPADRVHRSRAERARDVGGVPSPASASGLR